MGGAEQVTIQILNLLRERSHCVGALLPVKSPVRQAVARVVCGTYAGKLGGAKDSTSIAAIIQAVNSFGPQIVLVTTSSEWRWSCMISRRLLGAPLVLVRHMSLKLPATVLQLANQRADAVIAISESVRQNLIGPSGIRNNLIRVIRNPVRFAIRDEIPSRAQTSEDPWD
jgi:hypothetical protein